MRLLVVAMLVLGCGKSSSRSEPAPAEPPAARAELAARGATLATVASLPRADWPVQIVWYTPRGRWVKERFEYAGDAPCKLPVAMQVDGVVGCPTRSVTTYEDGDTLEKAWTYDERRRLHDADLIRWNGDQVVGMYKEPEYRVRSGDGPNLALQHTTDDGVMDFYRVEAGRALAHYRGYAEGEAPATLTPDTRLRWSATRLLEIERASDKGYLEYADTPATERAETTARLQREAADHAVALLATVSSVPRSDWPCARVVKWGDGESTRSTFQYDPARPRCVMPLLKLAGGQTGCESGMADVRVQADGTRTEDTSTVAYDGDQVRASRRIDRLYEAPDAGPFEKTATGLRVAADRSSVVIDLAGGKPVRVVRSSRGMEVTSVIKWKGDRIESIATQSFADQHSVSTFEYDCAR